MNTPLELMNNHNVDMKEALCRGTMKNYYTTQKYREIFKNAKTKDRHFIKPDQLQICY